MNGMYSCACHTRAHSGKIVLGERRLCGCERVDKEQCMYIESEMVGTAQLKHNCGSFVKSTYVGAAVGLTREGSY